MAGGDSALKQYVNFKGWTDTERIVLSPKVTTTLQLQKDDTVTLTVGGFKKSTFPYEADVSMSPYGIKIPRSSGFSLHQLTGHIVVEKTNSRKTRSKRSEAFGQEDSFSEEWLRDFVLSMVYEPEADDPLFDDVAGMEEPKEIVLDYITWIQNPDIRVRHPKYNPPAGLVLFGPGGCGKTLFAQAVAKQGYGLYTFFNVTGGAIRNEFLGRTDKVIEGLFNYARERSPSVIFFDEFDHIAGNFAHYEAVDNRIVNIFKQEMSGIKSRKGTKPVFCIGATNFLPDRLNSNFIRRGRFEKLCFVDLPDEKARQRIFVISLQGEPLASDIDFKKLAALSKGYTGSDIQDICDRTVRKVVKTEQRTQTKKEMFLQDLIDTIHATAPHITQKEMSEYRQAVEQKKAEAHL